MRHILSYVLVFVLLATAAHAEVLDTGGAPIAVIVLSPLLLGVMLLAGGFLLDKDEHGVLRVGIFLMSLFSYFITAWMGMQTVVKYYDFVELQDSIGLSVWVFGGFAFVVMSYFLIYAFYQSIQVAAQKKKEMMLNG